MAEKLELDLNRRVEKQFKRNMLSFQHEDDSPCCSDSSGTLCREREDIRSLADALHRLFFHLQCAYSDFTSLKVAKEIALQFVSGQNKESLRKLK